MDPAEARRVLGLDPQKKYVVFPYNPAVERKRYDLIEAAVDRAREKVPDLEILHVHGIPQDRVPVYMNAADVFVLASVIEGSPNSVKEAMAVNLPVIAVNVGDTVQLVDSTEGNYIVPRTVEAVAAKLVEVVQRGRGLAVASISSTYRSNVSRSASSRFMPAWSTCEILLPCRHTMLTSTREQD